MAKVSGPLLSMSASGTVGKAMTFANWKGKAYCREWFKPQNPKTAEQIVVRNRITTATQAWGPADAGVKAFWNARSKSYQDISPSK